MNTHILSIVAQNNPGVISRITGLLRRKKFNIDSMTAGKTHKHGISRLDIVFIGDQKEAEKAVVMVQKLVEVLEAKIISENIIIREIVLGKFQIHNLEEEKFLYENENMFIHEIYREKNTIWLEIVDTSLNLDSYLEKIQNSDIEILEWVRSGVIAIEK